MTGLYKAFTDAAAGFTGALRAFSTRLKEIFKHAGAGLTHEKAMLAQTVNEAEIALHKAVHEAELVVEGAAHTDLLAPQEKQKLAADLGTLATESALTLAKEVELPVTIAVTVAEEGAVLAIPSERKKLTPLKILGNAVMIFVSNPIAAAKAGADVICDLEIAGRRWEDDDAMARLQARSRPLGLFR